MTGWLEASWANVILISVIGIVVCVVIIAVLEHLPLRRQLPPHSGDWDVRELTDSEDSHD